MKKSRYEYPVPEHQADAVINVVNPTSGLKYEWTDGTNPLGTQKNARILELIIRCTWTVQPTSLEVHITIDGEDFICTFTDPVSDTPYYPGYMQLGSKNVNLVTTVLEKAFLWEGRSIKLEAEITGGTVQALDVRIKWAKW